MAKIGLEHVTHFYRGNILAVDDVNWVISDGCASALLGPSGCGKTTLMKIIAGLLSPTRGKVLFNDRDVSDVSVEERDVAMVFQFPVVYSMSVFDNLAFPLRNRGVPKGEVKKRVIEAAGFLGLSDKLREEATGLGPGDQQKVALGRAVVRENPSVVMLDEPLTDIEPESRVKLRLILKEIQRDLKHTLIYVTHDQTEAFTLAEKVALMRKGKIIQYDHPKVLYEKPKSTFVGFFVGSPGMNILNCTLSGDILDFGEFSLPISSLKPILEKHGSEFQLGIRPESVQVSKTKRVDWISFKCRVREPGENVYNLGLVLGRNEIIARTKAADILEGDDVWVRFPEDKTRIFDKKGNLII